VSDDQLDLFNSPGPDQPLDDATAELSLDAEASRLIEESNDAAAREGVALSRLALSAPRPRPALHPTDIWRSVVADPRRPLVARPVIPDSVRAATLERYRYRCVSHYGHTNDVTLTIGHIISLEEAEIMVRVQMRRGGPLDLPGLVNRPEALVAECSKCNFGHHGLSFTPAAAMAAYLQARPDARLLDPDVCLRVIDWCRTAQKWRPA
jgi:hypothetical protein